MKRRYKALIAIVVPVILVSILKYTHAASYQWIMGYMVAVALVFKTSIASMWLAAELTQVYTCCFLSMDHGIHGCCCLGF